MASKLKDTFDVMGPSRADSKFFFLAERGAITDRNSIDTIYLGRETSWKPDEGTVPDPTPYGDEQYM